MKIDDTVYRAGIRKESKAGCGESIPVVYRRNQKEIYTWGAIVARKGQPKKWEGYAREEMWNKWLAWKAVPVDIYATRFAERDRNSKEKDKDKQLVWANVPPGMVIRGLVTNILYEHHYLRIVTRQADLEEQEHFGHHRLPLLGDPMYD